MLFLIAMLFGPCNTVWSLPEYTYYTMRRAHSHCCICLQPLFRVGCSYPEPRPNTRQCQTPGQPACLLASLHSNKQCSPCAPSQIIPANQPKPRARPWVRGSWSSASYPWRRQAPLGVQLALRTRGMEIASNHDPWRPSSFPESGPSGLPRTHAHAPAHRCRWGLYLQPVLAVRALPLTSWHLSHLQPRTSHDFHVAC